MEEETGIKEESFGEEPLVQISENGGPWQLCADSFATTSASPEVIDIVDSDDDVILEETVSSTSFCASLQSVPWDVRIAG